MFDFDASKLLIIGVVALVVIGPKDLPRVLRQVGQMVGKLRRMAAEFQGQFMDAMKEADLADLQKEVSKLKDTASLDVNFNPVHDIRTSIITSVGSTAPRERPRSAEPALAVRPGPADPLARRGDARRLRTGEPPAIRGAVSALDADPIYLEPAEPAHHTPAESAGAVHAGRPAGDAGRAPHPGAEAPAAGRPARRQARPRRPRPSHPAPAA